MRLLKCFYSFISLQRKKCNSMIQTSHIKALIDALRRETMKNAITPEALGSILQKITDAIGEAATVDDIKPGSAALDDTIILEIDLGSNSKAFRNLADYNKVFSAMQSGKFCRFVICACYASGLKTYHHPTCVKASYISLHAKAGSCELHVSSDGTFTLSGTAPW